MTHAHENPSNPPAEVMTSEMLSLAASDVLAVISGSVAKCRPNAPRHIDLKGCCLSILINPQ
jgi:hypothetical protein